MWGPSFDYRSGSARETFYRICKQDDLHAKVRTHPHKHTHTFLDDQQWTVSPLQSSMVLSFWSFYLAEISLQRYFHLKKKKSNLQIRNNSAACTNGLTRTLPLYILLEVWLNELVLSLADEMMIWDVLIDLQQAHSFLLGEHSCICRCPEAPFSLTKTSIKMERAHERKKQYSLSKSIFSFSMSTFPGTRSRIIVGRN